ncbi:MAG: hypothetical protein II458_06775 [Oscillospiraceae bacterium]|nr:hypothetical protein [Oscillospiraceae bacterium]
MKRRISVLLSALLLALLLLPCLTATAWAQDYDEIVNYDITVQPNAEDGSLAFTVRFDWKALEELPHGEKLKIGIPNGSIRDEKALTDNIERLTFDNSYMYVYMDRKFSAGETFQFAYSWVQEYMYTLGDDGSVSYEYTPGWFDGAKTDHMTVTWLAPQGVSGGTVTWDADESSNWTASGATLTGVNLSHSSRVYLTASYPSWPTELDPGMSRDNEPGSGWSGWDDDDDFDYAFRRFLLKLTVIIIIVALVYCIIASSRRRDGYAGGFGTHYVFVNNLWYPAGPDGKPKPGSTGTAHKPKPPVTHSSSHSSGLGGGGRGGGFGGGGLGGGSHCACASSCACACACACAGGGRAGCSAKNLYGAVMLDEEMSRKLEGRR